MVLKLNRPTDLSLEHRILKMLLAGGLFLGLVILFFVPPQNIPFTCLFHAITGHSCLTCGMTRSLHAMIHGDWVASFQYHLFGPAVFMGMLLCLIIFTADAIQGKHSRIATDTKIRRYAIGMTAIVLLAYWGSRLASEWIA
jgi:hypothetical protein